MVIDLSFANITAINLNTFKDWSIDPSLAHDSDHNAIRFTIDNRRQEIDNILGIKYNINKVDPSEWSRHFNQELNKTEPLLTSLHNNADPSIAQLDEYTDTLSKAMQDAIALSAKERRPSSNAKPWWDQDLSNAAKRVADARIIQHEIQKTTGECSKPTQAIII